MSKIDIEKKIDAVPAPGSSLPNVTPEDPEMRRKLIEALREGWRAEIESMNAYRELAKVEPDKERHDILNRLADTEEKHAHQLEARLASLGAGVPEIKSNWLTRLRAWLLRQGGLDAAVSRME